MSEGRPGPAAAPTGGHELGPWARELGLLTTVVVAVAEADDALAAAASVARAVRRHCGFAVSHLLVPDDDGALVTADVWDADPAHLDFLERVLSATVGERFPPPRGLPGEVAACHLAQWRPDLARAVNYPRRRAVPRGAAWAFPVVSGGEVLGVVELVHPEPRPVDERLLQLAPALGGLLGRAFAVQRRLDDAAVERQRLERLLAARRAEAEVALRARREEEDARSAYLTVLAHDAHESLLALRPGTDGLAAAEAALARLVHAAERGGRPASSDRARLSAADIVRHVTEGRHGPRVRGRADDGGATTAVRDAGLLHGAVDTLVVLALRTGCGPVRVDARAERDALVVEVGPVPTGVTGTGAGTPDAVEVRASRAARALGGTLEPALGPDGPVARLSVPARWAGGLPRGRRVLLADDDDVNRRLGVAMLDRLGLRSDVVSGGIAALEAMRGTAYDVVLMDVSMPDLDGREATRRWRRSRGGATSADVPVVALTAHAGAEQRASCRDAGMDDHLGKPYGVETLAATLARWLGDGQPAAVASSQSRIAGSVRAAADSTASSSAG